MAAHDSHSTGTRPRLPRLALPRGRQWLKILGAAGLAGVATSGLVLLRSERQRRAYEPEEIRERLHERYAQVQARRDSHAD